MENGQWLLRFILKCNTSYCMRKLLLILPVIAMIIGMTTTQMVTDVYATGAFDSGFSHGQNDCRISNPSDMYINGVNDNGESTGPDHHTSAFMNGYNAGYSSCGGSNSVSISNHQEQNQAAYTSQDAKCGLILIGDCNVGQSSKNTFANDADN